MPWGEEIYKALEARTLDGLMVNVDSGYTLKVHETAPNVLLSKDLWLWHLYLLVMNRATWNGLGKEDKEAIQRAAEIAYKALGPVMDSSFDAMVDDMRRDGVKVRLLEHKELDAWKTATKYQGVQAAWVKEQAGKGIKDTGPVLSKVRSIINNIMKQGPF